MDDLISRQDALAVLLTIFLKKTSASEKEIVVECTKAIEDLPISMEFIICKNCKFWQTIIDKSIAEYGICRVSDRPSYECVMAKDGGCYKGRRKENE